MFGYTEDGREVFVDANSERQELDPCLAITRAVREPLEQGTRDPSSPRQGTGEHVRAMEYGTVEIGGKRVVVEGPILRSADPIRRGDVPSRPATSRFYHDFGPWVPDEVEIWSKNEDRADIERQQNLAGGMPRGRMNPMDEYRLLSDGSHA